MKLPVDQEYKDLIQSPGSDLEEDDVKLSVNQMGNETVVPTPDIIDGLDL